MRWACGEGGEAKLYTEGDSSGTKTESADPGAAAPADGSSAKAAPKKKEKTQDEVNAEKQKDWSGRVQKAQDEIKSLEDAITRNERALASMYNITPARADMANRIESDKKKLAALKQSLVSLEDERRRAGLARPR